MKKLLLSLLIPTIAFAQTPTPTPDPDIAIAQKFGVTVMEIKMQRIAQGVNEIRELQKVDESGKVGTAGEAVFDITNEQRQSIRQARRAKIQAIKQFCRDLAEPN